MTRKTFFKKLAENKAKFKWKKNAKTTGAIRGTIRNGPFKGRCVCPITAVTYAETGRFYLENFVGNLSDASKVIGLSDDDKIKIIDAADCNISYIKESQHKLSMQKNNLVSARKKMLNTLNFSTERD